MSPHDTTPPPASDATASRQYAAVPAKVDLAAMDQEILGFWAGHDVFHRSLAQRALAHLAGTGLAQGYVGLPDLSASFEVS